MDIRVSKLFIQLAFWAVICDAAITSVIAGYQFDVLGWVRFIDPVLLLILAFFLYKKSRVAAALLVIYQIMFQLILIPTTQDYIQIFWFAFFLLGLIGTLRYQKIAIEEGIEE